MSPQLFGEVTSPSPKRWSQMRLTITLGVRGLFLGSQPIGQFASSALSLSNSGRTAPGQNLEKTTRHFLGRLLDVAPE